MKRADLLASLRLMLLDERELVRVLAAEWIDRVERCAFSLVSGSLGQCIWKQYQLPHRLQTEPERGWVVEVLP